MKPLQLASVSARFACPWSPRGRPLRLQEAIFGLLSVILKCSLAKDLTKVKVDCGLWKESFHVIGGQAGSSQGRLCDWYLKKVPHCVRLLIPTADKA